MQLHLHVVDVASGSGSGPGVEVVVDAPMGAVLADVAPAVATAVQGCSDGHERVFAGQESLAPDALVGMPPLLHGALLHLGGPAPLGPPAGPVQVLVTRGPDSGLVAPLGARGVCRVGRAAEASIRIGDERVSRIHAEIALTSSGVTVCDAGSTNGSRLGGQPLGPQPVEWRSGVALEVGRSVLELRPDRRPPAQTAPDGQGGSS